MKRLLAAIVVWAAAAALFATINAQAKPTSIVTPDVVGMTVAEAVEAWLGAGFEQTPVVEPGALDPGLVPDVVVIGQWPEAGEVRSTTVPGVLSIDPADAPPTPLPPPGEDPSGEATEETAAEPAVEPAPAVVDTAGAAGSLSFTL
jgi:hypothetical protein